MRVLFAGGGTGGHIYPGITIADALKASGEDVEALFVGSRRGLENEIVPRKGYRLVTIDIAGFERRISLKTAKTLVKAFKGCWQALGVIRSFRPDVVVGTGGYVCGPVVMVAKLLRIPALIHEQNAIPGVTNRILSAFVDIVAATYSESVSCFRRPDRVVVTGNPVRPSVLAATREGGSARLGLDPQKPTLLVFGGSQGARAINQAMIEGIPLLLQGMPDIQIIHQTGKLDYDKVREELRARNLYDGSRGRGGIIVTPYIYEMENALAAADLVVSRAGAISIAEITARGLPAILIPLPTAAEHHQERNARALEAGGAARVILEPDLDGRRLAMNILELLRDKDALREMAAGSKKLGRPEATRELVRLVKALASRGGSQAGAAAKSGR
ncbi:MAG: undecaprenyldiphospho-muramoylpentapeptide beta-N-acetylglucosaminyltransferase [Firmicutes bacterium]|nr:undecaprenyldiphospho-muramoylpentapeptide beta-N-acetylglucosaminyltransferase [Bacillota bacterium]